MKRIKEDNNTKIFFLIIAYLIFEYGRPQTFFPFISIIRPAMIIQIIILYYVAPIILTLKFKEAQTKSFFILILIMIPHVFFAVNNYYAFNTLKAMFLFFSINLAIIEFVVKYEEIVKLIDTWLVIIFICGVIGVMYGGKIPGSSIMGDENDFSLVMNMAFPIAFFLGLESDRKIKKMYYFCASGVFIIAAVSSFSRGGFVGLASVGLYCWLKSPQKILSSVIIVIFILLMSLTAPEKYWDEVRSIKEENIEKGTGATRWYTWECGLRIFLDYPIFGVGQGNFPWNFAKYEPEGGFQGRMHGGRVAHSVYFTLIPELGLVGTFLFLFITYKNLKESKYLLRNISNIYISNNRKLDEKILNNLFKIKYLLYGLQGSLFGFLISGIFLSVLYYPHFWLLNGIFICIFKWCRKTIDAETQKT